MNWSCRRACAWGGERGIWSCPKPPFHSESNSKLLICKTFFYFHAIKLDYSPFLAKGFALHGLDLKLRGFATRKWPQLYIKLFFYFSFSLFQTRQGLWFSFLSGKNRMSNDKEMQYARRQYFLLRQSLETFGFEDENDYEYNIWLKAFSRILEK